MKPFFAADSIGKSYGDTPVLTSASVWAHPGRITALFGRNGCGKSTMLKVGAGVLRADHGAVHYDGEVYLRPRLHRLARAGLFYLPDARLLAPRQSLRRHLEALAWRFHVAATVEIVDALGLHGCVDQPLEELSGGERRKSEIAVALARQPRCLLADEPFAGISPRDAGAVAALLKECAASGCALLVTGHEVPQLLEIADDVIWMVAGTTHHIGTPRQAVVHEQFRREYLGPIGLAT